MKRLIGKDQGSYIFDPAAKTITFSCDTQISLEQVLTITNTTDGIMIYCFADPVLGGTIAGQILTLEYNTSSMSADDALQIYVDIPEAEPTRDNSITQLLRRIVTALLYPPWVDRSANAIRNQVQSGTITAVTTVTTCTTTTNLSQIDTMQGRLLIMGTNINSWANAQRRTIS